MDDRRAHNPTLSTGLTGAHGRMVCKDPRPQGKESAVFAAPAVSRTLRSAIMWHGALACRILVAALATLACLFAVPALSHAAGHPAPHHHAPAHHPAKPGLGHGKNPITGAGGPFGKKALSKDMGATQKGLNFWTKLLGIKHLNIHWPKHIPTGGGLIALLLLAGIVFSIVRFIVRGLVKLAAIGVVLFLIAGGSAASLLHIIQF